MIAARVRATATLCAAAALTACAGSETTDAEASQDNVYLGDEPVYAVLERRGDGQWTLGRVLGDNAAPGDGFLLRLNDLAPAFDTRPAECEPRPYAENDRCNPLNPFREKDMGVVGKIVDTGIAAGTGGKISSVSRSYTTTFDELTFNAAVDEALLLTGLDRSRPDLLEGLRQLERRIADQNAEIADVATRTIRAYERDKRENIVFDLEVDGLEQYYSRDIDPADFVDVLGNAPAASQRAVTREAADILPCNAEDCIDKLNARLDDLDREHDDRLRKLRDRLATETRSYAVDCDATEHDGYHFRLSCPDDVARKDDGLIVLPVRMTILSRDFRHLFPSFARSDDSLSATVEDGRLWLENLTDDYVDVQSVSLYYNSHINTVADDDGMLDLAPHQRKIRPLADFSSTRIDIESEFANMTPDKAARSEFSFGLAIKYSLRDRDRIETIYAVNEFDVACAIDERLGRGGPCERREPPG